MIFPSVDLPAPFSPTRAWIAPRSTSRSTALSACTPPKRLSIPRRTTCRSLSAGATLRPRPPRVREPRMRHRRRAALENARDRAGLEEDREVAWVLVEDDGVEDVAGRDPPVLVGDAAKLGAARGRDEQRLLRREPRLSHQRELFEVLAVLLALDVVRSRGEREPDILRDPYAFADVEPEGEDLLALPRREGALSLPSGRSRASPRGWERESTQPWPFPPPAPRSRSRRARSSERRPRQHSKGPRRRRRARPPTSPCARPRRPRPRFPRA